MSDIGQKYNSFLTSVEESWHKKTGLFSALVLIILLANLMSVTLVIDPFITLLIILITFSCTATKWFFDNYHVPITRKDKIGFIVSIRGGTEETKVRIKQDFIDTLRGLLSQGATGNLFQFIELPYQVSNKILDRESASKIRLKSKAHYIIYGRVREKIVNEKEIFFFELDGEVAHSPIPKVESDKLAIEFSELLPRRIEIPKENDLYSFEFTSGWTIIVSKYVIAIAAACSGDLEHALSLFKEIDAFLKHRETEFKPIAKIKDRIPNYIREIYLAYAKENYKRWCIDRDSQWLVEIKQYLESVPENSRNNVSYLTQLSIVEFLINRNIKECLDILHRIKHKDAIWYFNVAFLYAYNGELNKALKNYRKAIRLNLQAEAINEIEEFIFWIVNNEPGKYQLYYCLGFYNWKVKGDFSKAIEDFENFLVHAKNDEFQREQKLTYNWIGQIKIDKQNSEQRTIESGSQFL